MLIMLYTMGGVQIRLLGANGFHVKAKNERFTAASFRRRQNLKYEKFKSFKSCICRLWTVVNGTGFLILNVA